MTDTPTRAGIDAGAQALYELAGREWPPQLAPQTPWAEQSEDVRRHWKERAEVCLYHASKVRGSEWRPIETAPKDGTVVEVYAPSACGAAAIIAISSYHVDAGWTICTVREATHWRRHAPPVGEG